MSVDMCGSSAQRPAVGQPLLCLVLMAVLLGWSLSGQAEIRVRSKSLQTDYLMAMETGESGLSLQRAIVRPAIRLSAGRRWQFDGALRVEYAGADTGLGTMETYSQLSEPVTFGDDVRLEFDKVTASWRRRSTHVILGKQTMAWGVLDGVRVTDRFDPVRLRDAFFTEHRPERLSRWGARLRFERWGLRFDIASAFDSTVTQNAEPGSAFFPRASRLRGGLPDGSPLPDLTVDRPSSSTLGLRALRTFGSADLSFLAIRGPDTDPVFAPADLGVRLEYPDRTLLGLTWEKAAGPRIWRFETAWIPKQTFNLAGPPLLRQADHGRLLAGAGLDWKLHNGVFVNMQLGVDQVDANRDVLTRPERDVVATFRGHKDFANSTVRLSAELLTSLSDGDFALRPQLSWQVNDRLRLATGADIIRGSVEELLGQFEQNSRIWFGARIAY